MRATSARATLASVFSKGDFSNGDHSKGDINEGNFSKGELGESQRWKKVEVQRKRSYTKVLGGSRYQDELDIGAGTKEYQGAGRQVRDDGRNQVFVGVNFEDLTGGVPGQEQEKDTWTNRTLRTR